MKSRCFPWLISGLFLCTTPFLSAQPVPVPCEFPVGDDDFRVNLSPDVAYADDGGFVIVYKDDNYRFPETGQKIRLRRFDASGNYLGPTTVVDGTSFQEQLEVFSPVIERDASGDFVLAWGRSGLESGDRGVFGRRLADNGSFLGAPFQINTQPDIQPERVALATHGGGFFVVWADSADSSGGSDIIGRLAAVDGTFLSDEIVLNAYTTGDQAEPSVTATEDGEFLVVWRGTGATTDDGILGRRFDSIGTPLSDDVQINATSGVHSRPAPAAGDEGFLVVWNRRDALFDPIRQAVGRRLDGSLAPLGDEFAVSTNDEIQAFKPSAAHQGEGEFRIVWQTFEPGSFNGYPTQYSFVSGRTLNAAGELSGTWSVSTNNNEYDCIQCDHQPAVDVSPGSDEFLVVWGGFRPPSSDYSVETVTGRRFDGVGIPTLEDLAIDLWDTEDPSDGLELDFYANLINLSPCPVEDVTFEVTLPQAVIAAGYSLAFDFNCQEQGANITCQRDDIGPGRTTGLRVRVDPLPNADDELEISGSIASLGFDPDLSNNSDTETTQLVSCFDLALAHRGKGLDPVFSTAGVPCRFGLFQPATPIEVLATPSTGGWRVAGWTGTDDDDGTSRSNVVTMPGTDHQVEARYTFDDGISWWTADQVLTDSLGPNDLTQLGAGDVFDADGRDGQAFLLDGDPILQAPFHISLNLGTSFSLGFWLRAEAGDPGVRAIVDQRQATAEGERGLFAHLLDGRPALRLADGSTSLEVVAERSVTDDRYHWIVYTLDQGDLRIYIDGRLDTRRRVGGLGSTDAFVPLTVGSASFGPASPLNGRLDDLMLADTALGPDRLQTLFLEPYGHWPGDGNGDDVTTFARHASLAGGAAYTEGRCNEGFDLSLDGATVTLPAARELAVRTTDMAISAWIKAADVDGTQKLFEHQSLSTPKTLLTLENGILNARPTFEDLLAVELGDLRDGAFHHVVLSVSPGPLPQSGPHQVDVYVDGNVQSFETTGFFSLSFSPTALGGAGPGPAVMDDIYFFDHPLDANQVAQLGQLNCGESFFADGFESGNTAVWSQSVP